MNKFRRGATCGEIIVRHPELSLRVIIREMHLISDEESTLYLQLSQLSRLDSPLGRPWGPGGLCGSQVEKVQESLENKVSALRQKKSACFQGAK